MVQDTLAKEEPEEKLDESPRVTAPTPSGDDLNLDAPPENIGNDDVLIAYIRGEPLVRIFQPGQVKQEPLTMEETWTGYWHKEKKPPTIGHFNKSLHEK